METMSSASVRPRLELRPEGIVGTWGPKVCDFAEELGITLDEWQRYVVDGLFAVNAAGHWAASEYGLLVSRQVGKGEVLVVYDAAHLFLFPRADGRRKTILHSAHEVKTAIDGFQRLQGVIEANDFLMDRVADRGIKTGNGQEGITLKKRTLADGKKQQLGDRIRFVARSRNSGRGFAADTLVNDEAQEFSTKARNALTYTQSSIPNRQELLTGTAPTEENNAEVFEGIRDRGRAGKVKRTGWMEYTPTGSEDPFAYLQHPNNTVPPKLGQVVIDLMSRQTWEESIPALDIRISSEVVAEQVERATDILDLAIERFSYWPNRAPEVEEVLNKLDLPQWDRHKNDNAGVSDGEAEVIAIAVGRAGEYATVAAAARYDDASIKVEHKKTEAGTMWVAGYVEAIKVVNPDALIVIDSKNAAAIIPDLDKAKLKYLSMNLTELTGAFAIFIERVNAGLVEHRDQAEVRASLKFAIPRAVGQSGFTWDASDPTKPVSHAQAVTWAVWGILKREAQPPREPAIVRGRA